jgi:hypothetical protein
MRRERDAPLGAFRSLLDSVSVTGSFRFELPSESIVGGYLDRLQAVAVASSGAVTVPMPSISLVKWNSLLSRNMRGSKS